VTRALFYPGLPSNDKDRVPLCSYSIGFGGSWEVYSIPDPDKLKPE